MFPKFDVPVKFKDLKGEASGQYWFRSDIVVLDSELKNTLPGYARLVVLHEMIHSTANKKRLNRLERLVDNFGPYAENSMTSKMEECIAEIGCMVVAMKLGLFNEYSKTVILKGLEDNYTDDMYIPIREIRAAVKYYADDSTSFEEEIEATKQYLDAFLDIKFQETYKSREKAS